MTEESEIITMEAFVPLKPRAYHIGQAAIELCNAYELPPAETIVAVVADRERYLALLHERDTMIASLKNIVPTDGRPIYTLEEFGVVMRKVCQVEGGMLHDKQKGFFQALFASLTQCISDKGLMRK